MKKMLSVISCSVLLLSLASCSEGTMASNTRNVSQTTSDIETSIFTGAIQKTPAEETTYAVLPYDVLQSELDKEISLPAQSKSFNIRISSLWKSIPGFSFCKEITAGLFLGIDFEQSADYSTDTQFVNKYIEHFPTYDVYVNKNGVSFVSQVNDDFSVYMMYNNGTISTIYFQTKSEDGLAALSQSSIDNILDTISLITEEEIIVERNIEPAPKLQENPVTTGYVAPTSLAKTYHFVLNTDTNCVHSNSKCSAAEKILPENYAEIDISEDELASYKGVYWACGKCCNKTLRDVLPKL